MNLCSIQSTLNRICPHANWSLWKLGFVGDHGRKAAERRFKPGANGDEQILGYAVALDAVLGEQVCLYVRHAPI